MKQLSETLGQHSRLGQKTEKRAQTGKNGSGHTDISRFLTGRVRQWHSLVPRIVCSEGGDVTAQSRTKCEICHVWSCPLHKPRDTRATARLGLHCLYNNFLINTQGERQSPSWKWHMEKSWDIFISQQSDTADTSLFSHYCLCPLPLPKWRHL